MPDQCYFTDATGKGDWYQCLMPTNPGESPATHPEKWCRIVIPKSWRKVMTQFTYANLLEADGQTDKAVAQRQLGEQMEHNGLEVMIRNEANRDTWRTRPNVQAPVDPLAHANIFYSREVYDLSVSSPI